MAKNTKQIALIQHRRGKLSELPKQLNVGEFGIALDTNELFIGNPDNPALSERIAKDEFPWGNIQVLTEFSDNLEKITYRYESNTDIKARLPIVITGSTANPSIAKNTSLIINDVEIVFDTAYSLNGIINKINSYDNIGVKAYTSDNAHLTLISTGTEITLEDGVTTGQGIVERLGFGENSYTAVSSLPVERTLQKVLDDQVTVKSYNAFGDGVADDSEAFYNAIISLNKAGNSPQYFRTLLIPSGIYKISTTLPLPKGVHLKGEGIGRTIIKTENLVNAAFATMDDNMIISTMNNYGENTEIPSYITVEDLTIDVSDNITMSLLSLGSCENVLFKNVEFKGSDGTTLVRIEGNANTNKFKYIVFDTCCFNNGRTAIKINADLEHLIITNSLFNNFSSRTLDLSNDDSNVINSVIDGNMFKNCISDDNTSAIDLGINTKYISVINNKFDEDLTNYISNPYNTNSELNYTDILNPNTDEKKLLKFKFTQPIWEYIDYLINPNGEYLIQPKYNYINIDGEDVVRPLTNSIILEPGDESNDDTVTIKTSKMDGNINLNSSGYGDILLGKNGENVSYELWNGDTNYAVGDRCQMLTPDGGYAVYEALSYNINVNPEDPQTYPKWKLLGVYNPKITFYKNVDLNGSYITDTTQPITFKTTNENWLEIDDTDNTSGITYAERIATHENAIPNISYVNTIAQTTIRKVFNYDSIKNVGTNKQEICFFNPEIYGDYINMNYLTLNVRRPFYPVESAIANSLYWRAGAKYYKGDVVKAFVEDPTSTQFKLYVLLNGTWTNIPNVRILQNSDLDGDGEPLDSIGSNGEYAIYFDNSPEVDTEAKRLYNKLNGSWYHIGSEEWEALYYSYIESEENPEYIENGVIGFTFGDDDVSVTLSINEGETPLQAFINRINEAVGNRGVTASINGNKVKIEQTSGLLQMWDMRYAPLVSMGFPYNEELGHINPNTAKLIKTFDDRTPDANSYIEYSVWLKSIGTEHNYVCTENHIAQENFLDDMGYDGSISKWAYIANADINHHPLKDVKYVSILVENDYKTEKRLMFLKNVIDVSRRNFNSIYQPAWAANTSYTKGQRVLYAGRYWECLANHTSVDEYDLHNKDLWLAVPEEGYNYHFDFERDMYEIDDQGNIKTSEDLIIDYNFSNYHFYLMFYDENGKEIVPYQEGTSTGLMVSPSGHILLTINYIRTQPESNNSEEG